jgi:hypothetical protein
MAHEALTHRLAGRDDLEALKALMDAAISELQRPFLDENQIASSRPLWGSILNSLMMARICCGIRW